MTVRLPFLLFVLALLASILPGCTEPVTPTLVITPGDGTLIVSSQLRLTVTRQFPGGGPIENVTTRVAYSSSNPAIATVVNNDENPNEPRGMVKAGAEAGSVVIRATDAVNGATAAVTLDVQARRIATLEISPTPAVVLPRGTTQQFTARAVFNDGTAGDVTQLVDWTSTNVGAALVGNTPQLDKGIVRGVAQGDTAILATDNVSKAQARTAVFVTGESAQITAIVVTPNPGVVGIAKQQAFAALGVLSDGTTRTLTGVVTWASSRPDVATVDAAGIVTGVAAGDTTITAQAPEPNTTIRGSAALKVIP